MTKEDSGKLLELAAKCEAANGPDRELDAEIAVAVRWRWEDWCEGDLKVEERDLAWLKDRVQNSHNSIFRHLPCYTASLDAAMTLVPEGWFTRMAMEDRHSHSWRWDLRGGFGFEAFGRGATAALAVVIASLKARAHTLSEEL